MLTEMAAKLIEALIEKGETLAVAESCTGGMVSSKLTNTIGASQVFLGGVVAYSNQLKHRLLGVSLETMENFGAVSADCAVEMAQGVLDNLASDHAISITGVAGPGGGSIEKPVGLVYIGCTVCDKTKVIKRNFTGSRQEIREAATQEALTLLYNCLKECCV